MLSARYILTVIVNKFLQYCFEINCFIDTCHFDTVSRILCINLDSDLIRFGLLILGICRVDWWKTKDLNFWSCDLPRIFVMVRQQKKLVAILHKHLNISIGFVEFLASYWSDNCNRKSRNLRCNRNTVFLYYCYIIMLTDQLFRPMMSSFVIPRNSDPNFVI